MARIRLLEIRNFRSIRHLDWSPNAGINCLIGPGDSGKSTILDAIDLCLGARRNVAFSDTDFHSLDVTCPIEIRITLGALSDELLSLDTYGDFLRGYVAPTHLVEDEPRAGIETALTLRLVVEGDLEPSWTLHSARAERNGLERGLSWKDRQRVAPARIGNYAHSNLSWNRGSVLNRLTDERPAMGAELATAARHARASFGSQASVPLAGTLAEVTTVALTLGIAQGIGAQAMLDAHAVSIGDGAIALHDPSGVPLRALGVGSSRLLVAGLQRAAANAATVALVDEVEFGLEPHRLARLLDSIGAKDPTLPLQAFITTHSPVALRELDSHQLVIVRPTSDGHQVRDVGQGDDVQSTLRADPEVFLAKSVMLCEGASEVGFARGLDQFWVSKGSPSFFALGGAYANVGGGDPDKCLARGVTMANLGYRVMVFIDADRPFKAASLQALTDAGGAFLSWRPGRALETELFHSLDQTTTSALLQRARSWEGDETVDAHIRTRSNGSWTLQMVLTEEALGGFSDNTKQLLSMASCVGRSGWFKSLTRYQELARDVVGPNVAQADPFFSANVARLRAWMHAA